MASSARRARKADGSGEDAPRQVSFACVAPAAGKVSLAGTFNGWNPEALPMSKAADGEWSVSVDLPPGRHEYRFFIDDQWFCDPDCSDEGSMTCPKCVPNEFGGMNRFIVVG